METAVCTFKKNYVKKKRKYYHYFIRTLYQWIAFNMYLLTFLLILIVKNGE